MIKIHIQGIRYQLHPLFVFVMLGSVFTGYFRELVILFGIVLIHEMGHVAAAKAFSWRVSQVQLLPFGGVAVTDESGSVPAYQELIVALAGPFMHVWMIAFAWLMAQAHMWSAEWSGYFIEANLMIGLFNLLPIMPLDGGKILQIAVAYWKPYHTALRWCAWFSFCSSLVFILYSVVRMYANGIELNLLVIGLFLLYSNWYGLKHLSFHFLRFLMHRDILVSRLLADGTLAQPIVVAGHQTVIGIIQLFMKEKYHLIYVVDRHGRIRAVLPEQRITRTFLVDKKPQSAVSELFM